MDTITAAKCVSSRNLIAFLSIQEGAQKTRSTFERIVLLKTTGALNFLPFALNCSGSISKWDEMNFNEHNGHFCDYEYHSAFISDTQLVLAWPNWLLNVEYNRYLITGYSGQTSKSVKEICTCQQCARPKSSWGQERIGQGYPSDKITI